MLLIVASLVVGALREHRKMRAHTTQTRLPAHPLDRHVTMVLHMENGVVVGVEKPAPPPAITLPPAWYRRRRAMVSLGLLVMLLLAFLFQGGLTGEVFLQSLTKSLNLPGFSQATNVNTVAHPLPDTASVRLIRLDSALRNQYNNDTEWRVWAYSSCSGFAMTMVMNAYGQHLIAGSVLEVELKLGVWSIYSGLLREQGISMTANYFGFNADLSHLRTLQDLITISDKGSPIIVSVRDGRYFPGGHIFVVRGGDSQYVYLADSSPANFTRMTYSMFLGMWSNNHSSAILTPR